MQWILYLFLISTVIQKIPFNEIAPRTTEAFQNFLFALRNETIEGIGLHYTIFNRFLQAERAKSSENSNT